MADLQETITIGLPLQEVFTFLSNPENRAEILANVVKVEKIDGTKDQVGTRYKEVRQLSNRKVASQLEVKEFVRQRKVAFQTDSNGLKVNYVYHFEEVEEGTRVVFEGNVETNSLRTKIMRPLLVNMVRKEDGDHLLSAKKVLENE